MSDASTQPGSSHGGDLTGRQLGDFRLLRRLGHGAMAEVYLAEQSTLGRRVALKVLRPELANDQTYLKRFQREAQAAAALVHANIVQIYEVGHVDALHYIAQEYVEGQNLREWITRHGPPDCAHALSVMRQASAALAKAAEQAVVHRDIKPENIMLTRTGEVKVADFGLARFAREGDAVDLTQVGMTMGTPLYMSPEQVEGKPLDPRSDVYSLGVTCYHMLSGSPPFSGDTALGVAVQHLKRAPRPLEELRPDLPPALCRVVHKMMAKSPDHRYASAQDLVRELRQVQKEIFGDQWPEELPGWDALPTAPTAPIRPEITDQLDHLMKTLALGRPRRRDRWLLAGGLLIAAVIGGIAAWLLLTPPHLLADAGAAAVARQETPLLQWMLASQLSTEEGWQSVIDYFPKNTYWVLPAKQQLSRIHLREGNFSKALEIFREFANLGQGDERYRAFGLAGQYGVLTLQKRHQEAASVLEELWPIRDKLRDSQMQQMLQSALKKRTGGASSQEWQQWLDQQFGPSH